jgi:predicted phosphodiesterase
MKIQLVSDLHLNFSSVEIGIAPGVDVLVLAGDLSPHPDEIADWIDRKLPKSLPIVMVAGNHEYESGIFGVRQREIKAALKGLKSVHFLDNETWVFKGTRFLGGTMWSNFEPDDGDTKDRHDLMSAAKFGVVDFSSIRVKNDGQIRRFEPFDAFNAFKVAEAFIQEEMAKPFNGRTVVVSHFLPSRQCISKKFEGNPINGYFAARADHLLKGVDVWCHGHTHESVNLMIDDTRVLCNPRGYSHQFNLAENVNFKEDFTFEVMSPKPGRKKTWTP